MWFRQEASVYEWVCNFCFASKYARVVADREKFNANCVKQEKMHEDFFVPLVHKLTFERSSCYYRIYRDFVGCFRSGLFTFFPFVYP